MSQELGKSNKIRRIAGIKQMLRRWRRKAAASSSSSSASIGMMMMMTSRDDVPADVPAGYVAICVGSRNRRFVVRATYLNHPVFHGVLTQAAEEYGFTSDGPLSLPNCEESVFQEMIRFVSRTESSAKPAVRFFHPRTHEDQRHRCLAGESRPLLHHKTPIC